MLSCRKTDETVWNPLSTNPPISEQFLHDPLFVQILKTRNPPNFRVGGNYGITEKNTCQN